ncbi:MAG: biotin--[Alloprevotella sp.]|nr:biotin--[acetyl-CoA-carboxylase] ligase [Alloprevotella sp.]
MVGQPDTLKALQEEWKSIIQFQHFRSLSSTQSVVWEQAKAIQGSLPFLLIDTDAQTDGHGQVGTVWESEAGKNLLFSLWCAPTFLSADKQFLLSECCALAVVKAFEPYMACTVKWPNDIYYQDKKICGMLIDHKVMGGSLCETAMGIGININQSLFRGTSPNPVSLRQIIGHEIDRYQVLRLFLCHFMSYYSLLKSEHYGAIHEEYKSHLYRRQGLHLFADTSETVFRARIADIQMNGRIVLEDECKELREYAFKEIRYVI